MYMKKLLFVVFLFGTAFAQEGKEVLHKLKGEYNFKYARSLMYDEWLIETENELFIVNNFNVEVYENIKFIIDVDYYMFSDNPYYMDFYIGNKLITRHYISDFNIREEINVYDFLVGQIVLTLSLENNYMLLYHGFDLQSGIFNKVFVFFNKE